MDTSNNKWIAYALIGVGIFFLLGDVLNFSIGGSLWPFFVIAPGAVFIYAAYTGDRSRSGFIYPGLIVGGTGAVLLYQNMTGHWVSWAYIWTLYPFFVGLGLRFQGEREFDDKKVNIGNQMVKYSLIAFGIGFTFFEIMLFSGLNIAWVLVGLGIAALVISNKKPLNTAEDFNDTSLYANGEKPKVKNDEITPVI